MENFEERLRLMQFELPSGDEGMSLLREKAKYIDNHMQALKYPLNANQIGISLCAAYRLWRKDYLQVYTVPAG